MEPDQRRCFDRPFLPAADTLSDSGPQCQSPRLNFTPEVAKELVLLAELAGWEAFVPAMLDMATRPDECLGSFGMLSSRHTDLKQMLAGFVALNTLQSKHLFCTSQSLWLFSCYGDQDKCTSHKLHLLLLLLLSFASQVALECRDC